MALTVLDDALDLLVMIRAQGELACVPVDEWPHGTGGKKPASKDVFQFPRHLLTELDAVLARRNAEVAEAKRLDAFNTLPDDYETN
jgi:hypothetical protein